MSDARPQRHVLLPALRRFWALALLAGLAAGVTASWSVETTSTTTHSAEATYVVPLRPPALVALDGSTTVVDPQLPSSPSEASRYAQAYAVLLNEDPGLLGALAAATGQTPVEVRNGTSVLPVPDSSVLRVTYSAESPEQVAAYFAALQAGLEAVPAVSANIPTGNLRLLGAPEPQVDRGLGPLADLIGALVGLVVGLGVAVCLERLDPRLRSSGDVRELAPWPVIEVAGDETDERSEVLVERVLAAAPGVRTVAVTSVAGLSAPRVQGIAEQLDRITAYLFTSDEWVSRPVSEPRQRPTVQWVVAGRLAGDGAAERLAQRADVVLLAVPRRASLAHLTSAVQSLQDLLTDQPVIVALVPPGRRRRRPARARDAAVQAVGPAQSEERERTDDDTARSPGGRPERVSGTR